MAIVALLFAQLALSAFACELPFTQAAAAATVTPCHGTAPAPDPLCAKHCQDDGQAQPQAPHVLALPAPVLAAVVPLTAPAALAPPTVQRTLLHAAPPPLSIRHCRLTL